LGRTILLTGATDGLGLALARLWDARGERLVLSGRRPRAALADPLFARHLYVAADLAQPSQAARTLGAALSAAGIDRLDVLVHNAAVGSFGPVEAETASSIEAVLAVDLEAPIALTHALLPRVLAARGRIVFVSSVAADAPCPDFAVYAAAKAGLDGFARSLRVEVGGRASVLVLHPGATRTGIHGKSGAPAEEVERISARWPSAERVAAAMARAIDGRGRERTIGLGNRVARFACRHLPALVDRLRKAPRKVSLPQPEGRATPRALITGAADGIGLALAERLLVDGWTVVGVDRDAARTAAAPRIAWHLADLALRDDVARLRDTLARDEPFDLVVHNAGISCVGPFESSDLAAQDAVLAVNLRAPLLLTPVLLAAGKVRTGGALVFVSSLSHYVGYPGAAVYAASKDALAAYGRSLSAGLAARGLHVLTVFPGPTRTAHAARYAPPGADASRRMPPERVADATLRAVSARRRRLIPGLGNRIAARLGRWFPGLMDRLMRRLLLRPPS
jgi:short-subunit dehydrogenase